MGTPSLEDAPAASLGDAFVKSAGYKALQQRGLKGNWTTGPIEFGTKLGDGGSPALQVVSEAGNAPFTAATNYNPQILPGVQGPVEQRLTIADLLGQGTTGSNAIVYLKETLGTVKGAIDSGGDFVLTGEGALKPVAEIEFEKASATVDKIATFLPISDEMMEDEPQVVSYINGRLSLFVRQAEELYLLDAILDVAASASSAGEIDGDGLFDGIAAAMMHVRTDAGLEPDAVVVTPLDAAKMDVAKATGSGIYHSGGPYAAPNQNPWGLRRVVTTAGTDTAPLVGAFREGATVWRRGGLSVEASNSHADYFRRNLTALRAEERLAITIFRDDAFQIVDATS
jgi:HK97 family phage major capsid protein